MSIAPFALLLLLSPDDEAWQALKARVESAPQEVATFIERRANCNHFLGEEPYDAERSAELRKALRDLKCSRISRVEGRLARAYRDRPEILQLLKDTEDLPGW